MKKPLALAVLAVLIGALLAPVTAASAAPRPADRTVFLERTYAQNVDVGDPGSSAGDLRATRGVVRSALDGKVIGSYSTSQVTVASGLIGGTEQRSVIMEIAIGDNEVTMVSMYVVPAGAPPAKRIVHPIVGGTGKYAGAKGTLTLVPLDETQYRAVLRFV